MEGTISNSERTELYENEGLARRELSGIEVTKNIDALADSQTEDSEQRCPQPQRVNVPRNLPLKTRRTPKLTVVLDLDETLFHSSLNPIENPDQVVVISHKGVPCNLYVKYRPGLIDFLESAVEVFELVFFTASEEAYAEQILRKIDPDHKIKYRFYRDSCTLIDKNYVKDLEILGRDLNAVVIVDNSISAFSLQLENGIPISSWFSDTNDRELLALFNFILRLQHAADVRPYLCSFYGLTTFAL